MLSGFRTRKLQLVETTLRSTEKGAQPRGSGDSAAILCQEGCEVLAYLGPLLVSLCIWGARREELCPDKEAPVDSPRCSSKPSASVDLGFTSETCLLSSKNVSHCPAFKTGCVWFGDVSIPLLRPSLTTGLSLPVWRELTGAPLR